MAQAWGPSMLVFLLEVVKLHDTSTCFLGVEVFFFLTYAFFSNLPHSRSPYSIQRLFDSALQGKEDLISGGLWKGRKGSGLVC